MKVTDYFLATRRRPDRVRISDEWILYVCLQPEFEQKQADGRLRRWARISAAGDRYLCVVLLADGETIHNAFFDRRFSL